MENDRRLPAQPFLPPIHKNKISHNRFEQPITKKPVLSQQELFRASKSLKQVICVELLQNGYHRSFERFFHALSRDKERRDAAHPLLADTLPTALEEQPEKLHTMRRHLMKAEDAERSGLWSQVCEQLLSLGMFFSSWDDQWLRVHFLRLCTDCEQGRSSRAANEADAHLAEIYLQEGDLGRAQQHAESCLCVAEMGGWLDSSGFPLKTRAQQSLCSILSILAEDPLKSQNFKKAFELLHQALDYAVSSGNRQMEGGAMYKMAVTFQLSGDHSSAKQYLNAYIKVCQELDDRSGLSKAYRAMAESLESERNTDELVACLRRLADVVTGCQPREWADAFMSLGTHYYNMGEMDHALEYFSKAHKEAHDLGDLCLQMSAAIKVGEIKGQSMLPHYVQLIEDGHNDPPALRRLLKMRESRERDENIGHSENYPDAPQQ